MWGAIVPFARIPDDYFEEHYGRADGEPFSRFAEDFGFGYYDHDFVDTNADASEEKGTTRLVGECSFSSSFLDAVVSEAERRGMMRTSFVFLMYDVAYRPEVTGVEQSSVMAFLGSFAYDDVANSAFELEG